jgi:hypothetical protein
VILGEETLPRVPGKGTRGRGSFPECRSARAWHSGKTFFIFLANGSVQRRRQMRIFFCECYSSLSVALGEDGFPRVSPFPECHGFCRTRESLSSPSAFLSRVLFFLECNTRGRLAFPSARFLALGEEFDTRGISVLP